jgi:hypothetical protein
MPVERRGQAIRVMINLVNWQQDEPTDCGGERQLSMNGTSRVSREAQARICERLGVRLPGATRPSTDHDSIKAWLWLRPINEPHVSLRRLHRLVMRRLKGLQAVCWLDSSVKHVLHWLLAFPSDSESFHSTPRERLPVFRHNRA